MEIVYFVLLILELANFWPNILIFYNFKVMRIKFSTSLIFFFSSIDEYKKAENSRQ